MRGHRGVADRGASVRGGAVGLTLYRTFRRIAPATLAGLWEAMADVRAGVWVRSSVTNAADPVVLDIDAPLVEGALGEQDGAAPIYKGGFGFYRMLCFADATGERSLYDCGPATPRRTATPIIWPCSTRRWPSCRPR